MLTKPKRLAPEPFFSGAHHLLYQVALFMRNYAGRVPPEQLSDMADAIHNLPQAIIEYGYYFDEQMIRDIYLKAYDDKWAKGDSESSWFSLIKALDAGVEMKNGLGAEPGSSAN